MKSELELFTRLVNKLLEEEQQSPVVSPLPTSQVVDRLRLALNDEPLDENTWTELVENVVFSTPRTASKLFFNQLFGGRQPKAVLGDLLSVILNNSMYTYKVAGPQAGIEKSIIQKSCELVGYENGDGTMPPGGSMSNLMALIMARDAKSPGVKSNGVNQTFTLYTSETSHYSTPKNAAFAGVGRENIRFIKNDRQGRMDPNHLKSEIEKDLKNGNVPFYINATAGTTVLGAFDDINALADIAEEYKLWLHVDGAYCGAVIFSDKYKHLVNGMGRSDSFSYNAHKMLGTPLSCSIILTKHKEQLVSSFSNDAAYLYQTDAEDFDLGKTSLQCGRRNDALKFWTLWKAVGTSGLEEIVDTQFDLASYARDYVINHQDYTEYGIDESVSVCFNYKDIPADTLCTAMYEQATAMVGYGQFGEDEFVRLVTVNATNTTEDINKFFEVLEKTAETLVSESQ